MTAPRDIAEAWGHAMDEFDESALMRLAHDELEIETFRGTTLIGRKGLEEWLSKQTYGVAPRFERRRAFGRNTTIVVDLRVEFRDVDGGEVVGSFDAASVLFVQDGFIRKVSMHAELESALAVAGLTEADETELGEARS